MDLTYNPSSSYFPPGSLDSEFFPNDLSALEDFPNRTNLLSTSSTTTIYDHSFAIDFLNLGSDNPLISSFSSQWHETAITTDEISVGNNPLFPGSVDHGNVCLSVPADAYEVADLQVFPIEKECMNLYSDIVFPSSGHFNTPSNGFNLDQGDHRNVSLSSEVRDEGKSMAQSTETSFPDLNSDDCMAISSAKAFGKPIFGVTSSVSSSFPSVAERPTLARFETPYDQRNRFDLDTRNCGKTSSNTDGFNIPVATSDRFTSNCFSQHSLAEKEFGQTCRPKRNASLILEDRGSWVSDTTGRLENCQPREYMGQTEFMKYPPPSLAKHQQGGNLRLNETMKYPSPSLSKHQPGGNLRLNETLKYPPPYLSKHQQGGNLKLNETMKYRTPSLSKHQQGKNLRLNETKKYPPPSLSKHQPGGNLRPNETLKYPPPSLSKHHPGGNLRPNETLKYPPPSLSKHQQGGNLKLNETMKYPPPSLSKHQQRGNLKLNETKKYPPPSLFKHQQGGNLRLNETMKYPPPSLSKHQPGGNLRPNETMKYPSSSLSKHQPGGNLRLTETMKYPPPSLSEHQPGENLRLTEAMKYPPPSLFKHQAGKNLESTEAVKNPPPSLPIHQPGENVKSIQTTKHPFPPLPFHQPRENVRQIKTTQPSFQSLSMHQPGKKFRQTGAMKSPFQYLPKRQPVNNLTLTETMNHQPTDLHQSLHFHDIHEQYQIFVGVLKQMLPISSSKEVDNILKHLAPVKSYQQFAEIVKTMLPINTAQDLVEKIRDQLREKGNKQDPDNLQKAFSREIFGRGKKNTQLLAPHIPVRNIEAEGIKHQPTTLEAKAHLQQKLQQLIEQRQQLKKVVEMVESLLTKPNLGWLRSTPDFLDMDGLRITRKSTHIDRIMKDITLVNNRVALIVNRLNDVALNEKSKQIQKQEIEDLREAIGQVIEARNIEKNITRNFGMPEGATTHDPKGDFFEKRCPNEG